MNKKALVVIFILSLIVVLSLDLYIDKKYQGTDDSAQKAITEINDSYKPWVKKSEGIFSDRAVAVLFGVQGAAGITYIFYFIGKKKKCLEK